MGVFGSQWVLTRGWDVQEVFLSAFDHVALHCAGLAGRVVKVEGALCIDVVVSAVS
jgi:hypothetical protein